METSNINAQIIGEGNVEFDLGRRNIVLFCKQTVDFKENPIFVSKLLLNFNLSFEDNQVFKCCYVKCKKNGSLLYTLHQENGLYSLPSLILKVLSGAHRAQKKTDIACSHSILGHAGIERMIRAASENDVISKINKDEFNSYRCIPCIESVTKREPISWIILWKTQPLELTYSDISRKIGTSSLGNGKYFLVS